MPESTAETDGMALIRSERQRQIDVEGYTPDHDREHGGFALSQAATAYEFEGYLRWGVPTRWPWTPESWKPRDPISNLVRAGALHLAAYEQGYPTSGESAERCAATINEAVSTLANLSNPPERIES